MSPSWPGRESAALPPRVMTLGWKSRCSSKKIFRPWEFSKTGLSAPEAIYFASNTPQIFSRFVNLASWIAVGHRFIPLLAVFSCPAIERSECMFSENRFPGPAGLFPLSESPDTVRAVWSANYEARLRMAAKRTAKREAEKTPSIVSRGRERPSLAGFSNARVMHFFTVDGPFRARPFFCSGR